MQKINIGISSCLVGNAVRHDGSTKKNTYLMDTLSRYFEFRAFCPEMAAGLGVPRPAMRLKRVEQEIRLVESRDASSDHTEALTSWTSQQVTRFEHLSGFILKNASPSCGMERVKVFDHNGVPKKEGVGLFASGLMQALPALPVEEEGRLNDSVLRENFIQRVYVYHRWQTMLLEGLSVAALMGFHARHKYMLLAHDEVRARHLGQIIAGTNADNLQQTADHYVSELMQALKRRATRKRHTNVLMHCYGFIKQHLKTGVRQQILTLMDDYRKGLIPLVVPVTMIRHYLVQHPDKYIASQYYMQPYPDELMLRNDV